MGFVISGATGDVGAKVVEQLLGRGYRPRVFVRDAEKARQQFGDRVEIAAGDFADPASLTRALAGADGFFLATSGPEIPVLDGIAAKAAVAAGVKHLVKLSSMDADAGLAIGAWHKRGEDAICASGIPFTFVRPTGFMSNLLFWADSIKAEGVVRSATGEGRRPFIHSSDVAGVAVEALITGRYRGESLPLTGPEALTSADAAEMIGAVLGKRIRVESLSQEEARKWYAAMSRSETETEAHVALWRAIREGRLATVTGEVERILGRKPIGLRQWAQENAAAFV